MALVSVGLLAGGNTAAAQTTPPPAQTPVPRPTPFPGATPPPSSSAPQPAKPADAAARPTVTVSGDLGQVDPKLAGIAAYPGAEMLDTYDAGKNQRLFVFGTNDTYDAVVTFYKTQLKKSGEEVSRTPRIQQIDLANFDANSMAQRPSVIVKDYTWPDTAGYLHVVGTTEKRFKTLIQIIPK